MAKADHLIVPIPFHVKRYLHPRFNQSAELLIDDVMTTGANLYEAAKTLHRVGSDPFRGGQSWHVFCAMGYNLFYPVLIFLLNAMTEGRFCTMIW
ncbi:MAG: hypothetical protein ACJ0BH_02975 [Candidatus Puniceispirillaceae bacterium]